MTSPGRSHHLSATVSVDSKTFTKKLTFNAPVTPAECSAYLLGECGARGRVPAAMGVLMGGKYHGVYARHPQRRNGDGNP